MSILFKEDRILFTADAVPLKNDIPNYDNYSDLMNSLRAIKLNDRYDILLTSWTPPLSDFLDIVFFIIDGEEYMEKIDKNVKKNYTGDEPEPFMFCRKTIETLGLPPFFVNPIVDKAFKSHLI